MRAYLSALLAPVLAAGIANGQQKKPDDPPQAASTQQVATQEPSTPEPSTPEAIQQFNEEKVAELAKQIAGKEEQPAESVFKNIKTLSGIPAGRLLKIMQFGYSRSLGVSCAHCHVPGQWEKDDKAPKQITRDMVKMSHTIVFDLLRTMDGLKERNPPPVVNCTTCHRGQLKPALDLDGGTAKK